MTDLDDLATNLVPGSDQWRQAGILGFARLRAEAREERPLPPPANTPEYERWACAVLKEAGETFCVLWERKIAL